MSKICWGGTLGNKCLTSNKVKLELCGSVKCLVLLNSLYKFLMKNWDLNFEYVLIILMRNFEV